MGVLKFLKGVRNHWKKSLFAASALSYGVSYANEKYEINCLMRKHCEEAVKYGEITVPNPAVPPKRILVILNPAANKRSAEKSFEKYCEPVLHLAGYLVDVLKTDSEGHALRYVEELNQLPAAILVAGGDGTLSETVTGLLRRSKNEKCPVGILPVGRTNSVATKIYHLAHNADGLEEVRGLANSAISVVRGKTTKKDIMEIQVVPDEENESTPPKPIYALGSIQWGAYRDAHALQDKYWYLGPLRDYAASLFNSFGNKLTWHCKAQIKYTPPCSGCKNCYEKEPEPIQLSTGRWWSRFIPRFSVNQARAQVPQYSKIYNENCTNLSSSEIDPSELIVSIDSVEKDDSSEDQVPSLKINIGETETGSFDFISKSWNRIRTSEINVKDKILARTVELIPENMSSENKEIFYSIDNEPYEVRSIKVRLVPKAIDMYTL